MSCHKFPLYIFCTLLFLSLTGCNGVSLDGFLKPGIDDLLHPPKLTAEQTEISQALEAAVGSGRAEKLKYPQRGDYLSAFVMYDLDQDGQEEALVFYDDPNNMEYQTQICILDNDGTGWKALQTYPGNGNEVDQIQFVSISGQGGCDILIGWQQTNRELKTVNLYNFQNGQMKSLFSNTYSELLVTQLTGGRYSDLLLLEASASAKPVDAKLASLIPEEGIVDIIGEEYRLTNAFTSYTEVKYGLLSDRTSAVFVDGQIGGDMYCTDVLYYDKEKKQLTSHLLYDVDDYSEKTIRALEITCRDIDGDGIMEVPMPEPLPGYEENQEDSIYLINFSCLDSNGISRLTPVAVNLEAKYMLKFPLTWRDKVTVTQEDKSNEWRFWVYNGSISQLRDELLRIKVYSAKDYHDKFDADTYRIIKTKGNTEYYAYIPPKTEGTEGTEMSITYAQLEEMILFL